MRAPVSATRHSIDGMDEESQQQVKLLRDGLSNSSDNKSNNIETKTESIDSESSPKSYGTPSNSKCLPSIASFPPDGVSARRIAFLLVGLNLGFGLMIYL